MYFFGLSNAGIFAFVVICNSVMVTAQETQGQDLNTDVGIETEMNVTEVITDSTIDETSPTEVPSSSSSSTPIPILQTVLESNKPSAVVPKDTVKTPRCILLTFDGVLSVKYSRKNDDALTQNVTVSSKDEISGECPFDEDMKKPRQLRLNTRFVQVNFTTKQRTDGSRWYLSSIEASYNPAELFINQTKEIKETSAELRTSSDEYFMETPMDKSFACSEPRTIAMYTNRGKLGALLVLRNIQFQMYNVPKDGKFSPEFPCGENLAQPVPTESQETIYQSDTVPIAVGSCLAVITVLVIAGYAIYRSLTVKKLDYATMEE